ncbi:MAG: hypothetical protein V3R78_12445 [Thermodesulfobacteriota bacterium]
MKDMSILEDEAYARGCDDTAIDTDTVREFLKEYLEILDTEFKINNDGGIHFKMMEIERTLFSISS